MFGGKGYSKASSVLISGGAGTAKTSLAAHFMDAACRRGERALCFQFEESPAQYSAQHALDWSEPRRWVRKGCSASTRRGPTLYGLEFHLATMHRDVDAAKPSVVVVDPLSGVHRRHAERSQQHGDAADRLPQGAEHHGPVHASAFRRAGCRHENEVGVSSLMDTWILLGNAPPGETGRTPPVDSEVARHGAFHRTRSFAMTDRGVRSESSPRQSSRWRKSGRRKTSPRTAKRRNPGAPAGRVDPAALHRRRDRRGQPRRSRIWRRSASSTWPGAIASK